VVIVIALPPPHRQHVAIGLLSHKGPSQRPAHPSGPFHCGQIQGNRPHDFRQGLEIRVAPSVPCQVCHPGKKADVAEHLEMFRHVGLLYNEPPGRAGLSFIQSSDDFNSNIDRSRLQVQYGPANNLSVCLGTGKTSGLLFHGPAIPIPSPSSQSPPAQCRRAGCGRRRIAWRPGPPAHRASGVSRPLPPRRHKRLLSATGRC
jgi:hypothetical protein